jgi:cytochrome c-type biogenesis protein CcmH
LKRILPALAALAIFCGPALAVSPDEQLANPALEARARAISEELRCVVCQNQTIDESDAALAHDLRVILRERIAAGDTDDQAKAYLVQRYGSYVLLRPPLRPETLALWLGPLAVVLLGGVGVVFYLRSRAAPLKGAGGLDATEQAELAKLMNPDEAS